ncbi:hypothetical protein SSTU70S_03347 [Stutzerimonas stutzeri]
MESDNAQVPLIPQEPQPAQEAPFERALSPEDVHKAFVELDEAPSRREEQAAALKKLRGYIDADARAVNGTAPPAWSSTARPPVQIMGLAQERFTAASQVPRTTKVPAVPRHPGQLRYNIDCWPCSSSATRKTARPEVDHVARTVLEPEFQTFFNQNKGSIPVRQDMDMSEFDACAQQSMKDFKAAAQDSGLQPSLAHGMAASSYVQGAVFDVVTNFFRQPQGRPAKGGQATGGGDPGRAVTPRADNAARFPKRASPVHALACAAGADIPDFHEGSHP